MIAAAETALETGLVKPPKPGIYPGVRFDLYRRYDAINASTLEPFAESAKMGREKMLEPQQDTQAMLIGHAAHSALFEPDLFDELYIERPAFPGHHASNKYKAKKAEWEAEHDGQVVLSAEEHDTALRIREEVFAHPEAAEAMAGPGKNELTVIGEHEGEPSKGRLDRLTKVNGWPAIVDLKTFRKPLTPKSISDEITYRRYHLKAAWYLDLLEALYPAEEPRQFWFIFANNCSPWDVTFRELDEASIDQGRREYRRAFKRWRDGRATGIYPGAMPGRGIVSIAAWAFDGDSSQ